MENHTAEVVTKPPQVSELFDLFFKHLEISQDTTTKKK